MKYLLTILMVLASVSTADAQLFPRLRNIIDSRRAARTPSAVQPATINYEIAQENAGHAATLTMQPVASAPVSLEQQICQRKADWAASRNMKGHVLGQIGMGSGKYEGCSWNARTPQQALDKTCFSGKAGSKGPSKKPIAQAVAQDSRGLWYACVLYVDW